MNDYLEVLFCIIDSKKFDESEKSSLKDDVKRLLEAEVSYEFNDDRTHIPALIETLLNES